MSTKILLSATTAAHTIQDLTFSAGYGNCIGIVASDLSGTEAIKIRLYNPAKAGADKYQDIAVMDVTNPAKVIYLDAFSYVIEKPVTVNAVGIAIASNLTVGV